MFRIAVSFFSRSHYSASEGPQREKTLRYNCYHFVYNLTVLQAFLISRIIHNQAQLDSSKLHMDTLSHWKEQTHSKTTVLAKAIWKNHIFRVNINKLSLLMFLLFILATLYQQFCAILSHFWISTVVFPSDFSIIKHNKWGHACLVKSMSVCWTSPFIVAFQS